MWRPPEEIKADLSSGVARRITEGLRDLEEYMESMVDEFELPPLETRLLKPFGDSPPKEVLLAFARLLAGYPSFRPKLSRDEILYRLAELAVTYGNQRVAFDAAMQVKQDNTPTAKVPTVLNRLHSRGLHSEREVTGAGHYLSSLLDGRPQVRAATLAALEGWKQGLLLKAVERIRPELEPNEAKQLFP